MISKRRVAGVDRLAAICRESWVLPASAKHIVDARGSRKLAESVNLAACLEADLHRRPTPVQPHRWLVTQRLGSASC